MIGHALLRNQHLLNGCGRNAYQEAGFFLLGGNRFYNNGKGDLTGGDGKGIAAVQIVIVVICAGTIAGKAMADLRMRIRSASVVRVTVPT